MKHAVIQKASVLPTNKEDTMQHASVYKRVGEVIGSLIKNKCDFCEGGI